jgi:hypothetical protein
MPHGSIVTERPRALFDRRAVKRSFLHLVNSAMAREISQRSPSCGFIFYRTDLAGEFMLSKISALAASIALGVMVTAASGCGVAAGGATGAGVGAVAGGTMRDSNPETSAVVGGVGGAVGGGLVGAAVGDPVGGAIAGGVGGAATGYEVRKNTQQ